MEKPSFKKLNICLQNTGHAYFVCAIIGDCFCPNCKLPVLMRESVSGYFFYGQCKCGRYIEAEIILDPIGLKGKWSEVIS